jgi:hypothetical protein
MLQPTTGSVTCSECNAAYESETKLREHKRMSHRGGGTDEGSQTATEAVQSEDLQV